MRARAMRTGGLTAETTDRKTRWSGELDRDRRGVDGAVEQVVSAAVVQPAEPEREARTVYGGGRLDDSGAARDSRE